MSTRSRSSAHLPRSMKLAVRLVAALVCIAALFSGTVQAQSTKKIPGAVKAPPAVSIDQLARQADVVAVGRVDRMESEWNADKSRIQTKVTVAVEQTIKGETPDASMTVLVMGGEVDGVGEIYSHTVQFQKNEDVLVFASKDAKGNLRVTSGAGGKFVLQQDSKTGVKRIPNLGTVDEVSARIKSSIKAQKTETNRN